MTRPTLTPLFEARAVAIVGASADPGKMGGSVLANLRAGGFVGRIVPVNVRRTEVQGIAAVVDINPLVAAADGATTLDVRGVLA